ncbi:hypothetical protein GMRT_15254 [Giardia muris]|uniref:Uncharacterized protein n=1 Tax=Giardia muris TaxID=5742 RepID=A0A4Z1SXC6_GIAMU|nr:hypothetical protein GMRT_15254 [Giardia muris]|eukprot:TNJ28178.1 hypothetical protein GMRT_15254 [Giardia muris]
MGDDIPEKRRIPPNRRADVLQDMRHLELRKRVALDRERAFKAAAVTLPPETLLADGLEHTRTNIGLLSECLDTLLAAGMCAESDRNLCTRIQAGAYEGQLLAIIEKVLCSLSLTEGSCDDAEQLLRLLVETLVALDSLVEIPLTGVTISLLEKIRCICDFISTNSVAAAYLSTSREDLTASQRTGYRDRINELFLTGYNRCLLIANHAVCDKIDSQELLEQAVLFIPSVIAVLEAAKKKTTFPETRCFRFCWNIARHYKQENVVEDDPVYQRFVSIYPVIQDCFVFFFALLRDHFMQVSGDEAVLLDLYQQLEDVGWCISVFCDAENEDARRYRCREAYMNKDLMSIITHDIFLLGGPQTIAVLRPTLLILGSVLNALALDETGGLLDTVLGALLQALHNLAGELRQGSAAPIVSTIFWVLSNLAVDFPGVFKDSGVTAYIIASLDSTIKSIRQNAHNALKNILAFSTVDERAFFLEIYRDHLWSASISCLDTRSLSHEQRTKLVASACLLLQVLVEDTPGHFEPLYQELLARIEDIQANESLGEEAENAIQSLLFQIG